MILCYGREVWGLGERRYYHQEKENIFVVGTIDMIAWLEERLRVIQ